MKKQVKEQRIKIDLNAVGVMMITNVDIKGDRNILVPMIATAFKEHPNLKELFLETLLFLAQQDKK